LRSMLFEPGMTIGAGVSRAGRCITCRI
jgi:hypothetical protein